MSSIPQKIKNENEISDFVTKFMKEFQIGKLLFQCNAYSDPFCQDSFLLNLSLGDKHMFLQNIGTEYPLLPLMVLNLGIINVSRTCHEVVPASLIH